MLRDRVMLFIVVAAYAAAALMVFKAIGAALGQ